MDHRYTKKPVTIEAFQMTKERREDNCDWPNWLNRAWNMDWDEEGAVFMASKLDQCSDEDRRVCIFSLEGVMLVNWNDWIIQGVAGERYPCKPDIFEATYSKKVNL